MCTEKKFKWTNNSDYLREMSVHKNSQKYLYLKKWNISTISTIKKTII